jgi:hypothetical protein
MGLAVRTGISAVEKDNLPTNQPTNQPTNKQTNKQTNLMQLSNS